MTTLAPACTNTRAQPDPIPLLPPVISATLSKSLANGISISLVNLLSLLREWCVAAIYSGSVAATFSAAATDTSRVKGWDLPKARH